MPAGFGAVSDTSVEGYRDLLRAFRIADKELNRELRSRLKAVAEPVRVDAQHLAVQNIRRIGIPWSEMRIGVTRAGVYVAPKKRGVKTRGRGGLRRPNLFELLLGEALIPALAMNEGRIVFEMERLLEEVGRKWERA